jgi:hypothetical protein
MSAATPQAAKVLSDDDLISAVQAQQDPDTVNAFYNGYFTLTADELRRILAKLQAAPQAAQGVGEVAAWMWQHDETGRVGFVSQWDVDHGWQAANPRCALITRLYAHPAPSPAVAAPVTGQQMYEAYRRGAISQNREPCTWDELTSSAHMAWNGAAAALATQQGGQAK